MSPKSHKALRFGRSTALTAALAALVGCGGDVGPETSVGSASDGLHAAYRGPAAPLLTYDFEARFGARVVDTTGQALDAQLMGDAVRVPARICSEGAVALGGEGHIEMLPAALDGLADEGTISLMVHPENVEGTRPLVARADGPFSLRIQDGKLVLVLDDGTWLVARTLMPAGRSTMVAASWSKAAGLARLYIDGEPVAELDAGSAGLDAYAPSTLPLMIGADGHGAGLKGEVDMVRVYARMLSNDEQAALHKRYVTCTRPAGDALLHYSFDDKDDFVGDLADNGLGGHADQLEPAAGRCGSIAARLGAESRIKVPAFLERRIDRQFTLSATIKPGKVAGDHPLVTRQGEQGTLALGIHGGRLTLDLPLVPGAPAKRFVAAPVQLDGWSHVAATWDADAGAVQLYVDGQTVAKYTGYAVALPDDAGKLLIGSGDGQFVGDIDELQIHARALDADQIADLAAVSADCSAR